MTSSPAEARASRPRGLRGLVLRARREARRVTKFAIVGAGNSALDFAIYAALVTAGTWYFAAKAVGFVVATMNGYFWNRRWTFRAGAHRHEMLALYVSVVAIGFVTNLVVLALLVEVAGVGKVLAQLFALPAIALGTFFGQRLLTFRHASR
jgi:putative flippase GtrA